MRAAPRWILACSALGLLGWAGWSRLVVEPPPPEPLPPGPPPASEETSSGAPPGETVPELRVTVAVRQVEEFLPSPGQLQEQLVGGPRRLGDPAARPEHHVVVHGMRGAGREVRAPFVDPAQPHKIASGPPMRARARILDAAGKPLVGATLWLGGIDAADRPVVAKTDAEGRCELVAGSGEGVPAVAKAEGFASELRIVDLDVRLGELEFRLAPAAPLRVQVVGVGPSVTTGQVFVVPLDRVTTELSVYPFLLGTVFGGVRPDERGRAVLDDLPVDCEVGVVFVHPAAALIAPRPVKVSAKGAELILQVAAVATRQAIVRDVDGRPIVGARVLAGCGPGPLPPSRRLGPPWLGAVGAFASMSGAEGVAVAADAVPNWRVEAFGYAGRVLAPTDEVVLPKWRGGDASLVVTAPSPEAAWLGEADLAGGVRSVLPAGGDWRLALPAPGRYEVELVTYCGGERRAAAGPMQVDATGRVLLAAPKP